MIIFDPSTWSQEMQDLHSFGNTTLGNIVQKHEACLSVDRDSTVREWMRLKQAGKHLAASTVTDLLNAAKRTNPCIYTDIQRVLVLSLVLPLSSPACERGYSRLKITKSKYRSSLSDSRLSSLIHIHLSKMTTDTLDPKPAVDLWIQTANHRLNQGPALPRLSKKEDSEESSQEESDDDSLLDKGAA